MRDRVVGFIQFFSLRINQLSKSSLLHFYYCQVGSCISNSTLRTAKSGKDASPWSPSRNKTVDFYCQARQCSSLSQHKTWDKTYLFINCCYLKPGKGFFYTEFPVRVFAWRSIKSKNLYEQKPPVILQLIILSQEPVYNPIVQAGIWDHLGRWQMGLVTNLLILSSLHFHKCQHA